MNTVSMRSLGVRAPSTALTGRSVRWWSAPLMLVLTGCQPEPWQAFPMPSEPDLQCRTGREMGHDVFIWDCHEGRRVVVFQQCSALLGCDPAGRQTAACGSRAAIELELQLDEACEPVPPKQRWKPEGASKP